jgi:integron integrase
MDTPARDTNPAKPKLLDQVRAELRIRHYSLRTEEAYTGWIRDYIRYHGIRHPREMGKEEVEGFLSHLAVKQQVAAATQNQALAALLFLYRDVLGVTLEWLDNVVRAKKPIRLPIVLTREEVMAVLSRLHGPNWIAGMLMYGAGLRLLECLQLRIKDVDFGYRQIVVREGKGGKDRITMLPSTVEDRLKLHLEEVKNQHEKDLKGGAGYVTLPRRLERKYPDANR